MPVDGADALETCQLVSRATDCPWPHGLLLRALALYRCGAEFRTLRMCSILLGWWRCTCKRSCHVARVNGSSLVPLSCRPAEAALCEARAVGGPSARGSFSPNESDAIDTTRAGAITIIRSLEDLPHTHGRSNTCSHRSVHVHVGLGALHIVNNLRGRRALKFGAPSLQPCAKIFKRAHL